jgi:hypothetical protein
VSRSSTDDSAAFHFHFTGSEHAWRRYDSPRPFVFLTTQSTAYRHGPSIAALTGIMNDPLHVQLCRDEVIANGELRVSFRRTSRVPDNQQVLYLPPDLGAFPLRAGSEYAGKICPDMSAKGGLFFPMWRTLSMLNVSGACLRLIDRSQSQRHCGSISAALPSEST